MRFLATALGLEPQTCSRYGCCLFEVRKILIEFLDRWINFSPLFLVGLLAATIAQFGTRDLLRVVALGAYLHGGAAELLSLQSDPSGILAGEVADAIPYARRKLMKELQARA